MSIAYLSRFQGRGGRGSRGYILHDLNSVDDIGSAIHSQQVNDVKIISQDRVKPQDVRRAIIKCTHATPSLPT